MKLHFITTEIKLQASPHAIQKEIEHELMRQGMPLRWAITAIDSETHTAHVEAVVTTDCPPEKCLEPDRLETVETL